MITPAHFPQLLVAFVLPSIVAQMVSPYWRKPNITASPAERVTLAGAALAEAVNQLNPANQFFRDLLSLFLSNKYTLMGLPSANATNNAVAGCKGSFYGQMAEFDLITKQTMWEKTLKTYFQVAQSAHENFSTTKGVHQIPGVSCASWWFGRAYTLSQDDISAGSISTKNLSSLQQFCQGRTSPFPFHRSQGSSELGPAETMAGGTFWLMDPVKPRLIALSTGYFLVLSPLLAEATSDQLYLEAAIESRKFIQAHLLNDRNIAFEAIYAPQNYSCAVTSETGPYNTGIKLVGPTSGTARYQVQNYILVSPFEYLFPRWQPKVLVHSKAATLVWLMSKRG
ncbi:hypothetical protein B0H19DRAFT_1233073 [Mycena capillaripes]|nr:hypothetical protein B0H19DRAFT_1233073 [Mycena capillaripes]